MNKVLALILAGGTGERLSILAQERAKPAVVFGGKYRVIDFTLSNCANSGICHVGVLAQYRPHSLYEHIGIGKPWDLDRRGSSVTILHPFTGRMASDWFEGTAAAVYHNLNFVEESGSEQVLILSGDHVYTMRYEDMLAFHRTSRADVTLGVTEVPWHEASRYGLVTLDQKGLVTAFEEKPSQPRTNLASMGIYAFNTDFLVRTLREATHQGWGVDFGRHILPHLLGQARLAGYLFRGYWRDIGTIEAYYQANMDLIVDLPPFNLYDPEKGILTNGAIKPPLKTGPNALISRSLVSDGCIVNGIVRNSILSPGVFVEEGATVEAAIVFHDTRIAREAHVHFSVIDKEVHVGQGSYVGCGEDYRPNQDEPQHLNTGITVVGKRARIPPWTRISRNCRIDPGVSEGDFPGAVIPSGSTIRKQDEASEGSRAG